jgi:hypothetical protein
MVANQVPKRRAHMPQILDIVEAKITAVQRMRYTRNLSKNSIQQQPGQSVFSLNWCPVLLAACILWKTKRQTNGMVMVSFH